MFDERAERYGSVLRALTAREALKREESYMCFRPASASAGGGIQCPKCGYMNAADATECKMCHTKAEDMAGLMGAAPGMPPMPGAPGAPGMPPAPGAPGAPAAPKAPGQS